MEHEISLEEFNVDEVAVAVELAGRIQRISAVGICREDYDVFEQHAPDTFSKIDRRKLTAMPSHTQRHYLQ